MRARPKLLILESTEFSVEALNIASDVADVIRADRAGTDAQQILPHCEVMWVRLGQRIDSRMLELARNLKVIVSATTGLNHIDMKEAERRGIQVLSLQGETEFLRTVRATAEYTVALMLSMMRCIPAACTHVRSGEWNRDLFKGSELYEKCVGIVGYGRLGKIVARYLTAFEAVVLVYDPHLDVVHPDDNVTRLDLSDLLGRSDIVTLHASLTEETHGYFGRTQFAEMKRGAWFINTARGELVEEEALVDALNAGWLAGAALDVLHNDVPAPRTESALMRYAQTHDNLIITPHLGGCTAESMKKTEDFLARKMVQLWRSREFAGGARTRPSTAS